ncbi:MAG: SAM-dependent methyltransferase [Verrucomicrobiia bacterium]
MEPPPPLGKPELVELLRDRIAHHGPLPFSEFMRHALYAPGLGYYTSAPTLGTQGDFYTAVTIGPLFARFLAWQTAETWHRLGQPDSFALIEQGAHRAHMLADLLHELARVEPRLIPCLHLWIIEPDPFRQSLQAQTLANHPTPLHHVTRPAELPPNLVGAFLANELPDSFPVDRLRRIDGTWHELRVTWNPASQTFTEIPCPLRPELLPLLHRESPPDLEGFTLELCPEIESWFPELLERFATGHILLFDYALTRQERQHPSRSSGTLRTYHRHRMGTNPLIRIGQQDITYHIHATRLLELAHDRHWTATFIEQHRAFVGMIAAFLPEDSPRLRAFSPADHRALQTLVHPSHLGRALSALSFRKNWPPTVPPPSLETFAPSPQPP